jgi:hypothetical protein
MSLLLFYKKPLRKAVAPYATLLIPMATLVIFPKHSLFMAGQDNPAQAVKPP